MVLASHQLVIHNFLIISLSKHNVEDAKSLPDLLNLNSQSNFSSTSLKHRLQIIVESKPGWLYATYWQLTSSNKDSASTNRRILACSNSYLMRNSSVAQPKMQQEEVVEVEEANELVLAESVYTTSPYKILDIEDSNSIIGQAMSSGRHLWLINDADGNLDYSRCESAREARQNNIRTLVFSPASSGGVIEVGALVEVTEDSSLINLIHSMFGC